MDSEMELFKACSKKILDLVYNNKISCVVDNYYFVYYLCYEI